MSRRRYYRRRKTSNTSSTSTSTSLTSYTNTTTTTTYATTTKTLNIDSLAKSWFDDILKTLDLEVIKKYFNEREQQEIVATILEHFIPEGVRYVRKDQIIDRISRAREYAISYAIQKILELKDEPPPELLELIIYYGRQYLVPYIPKLYQLCKKAQKDDLIPILQSIWEMHIVQQYLPCPYCGFKALTPSLECIVCGKSIDDKILKEIIGFDLLFSEFLERCSEAELKALLDLGIVFFNSKEGLTLKPVPGDLNYPIYLDSKDMSRIRKKLS